MMRSPRERLFTELSNRINKAYPVGSVSEYEVFIGSTEQEIERQIVKARERGKIGAFTHVVAILDEFVAIDPARLRPERGSMIVRGFPDVPSDLRNLHPVERHNVGTKS